MPTFDSYLAAQQLQSPEHGARLGAIGHGPNGASLAERLCRHIDTWGADRTAKPSITIYPDSAPQTTGAQVIRREHCEMTAAYQRRAVEHQRLDGRVAAGRARPGCLQPGALGGEQRDLGAAGCTSRIRPTPER